MRKNILILAVLAVALCTLTISAGMIGTLVVKKYPILSDLPGVHVRVVFVRSKELAKHSSTLTEQHLKTMVEVNTEPKEYQGVFPGRTSLSAGRACP